jgi:hypothetical protein
LRGAVFGSAGLRDPVFAAADLRGADFGAADFRTTGSAASGACFRADAARERPAAAEGGLAGAAGFLSVARGLGSADPDARPAVLRAPVTRRERGFAVAPVTDDSPRLRH